MPLLCRLGTSSLRSTLLLAATALALAVPAVAQTDSETSGTPASQTPQSSQGSRADRGNAGRDAAGAETSPAAARDKLFLRKAAAGGLAEVQLGSLAAQKGASEEVRAFGRRMVADHTELNSQLKSVADADGIMLPNRPSSEDQALLKRLNALSGEDFDRAYLQAMSEDHHNDMHEFRVELVSTSDPALHSAVGKGTVLIHAHMTDVDALARARGIQVAGQPATASTAPSRP